MTDLSRLKVSLTKHNAHKVARLLKKYEASEVFSRLDEVQAEAVQTRQNLSTLQGDVLPPLWEEVRAFGSEAVDALVFLAIIFSHYELISAMSAASDRDGFSGRIDRGNQLDGKAYTNFARIIDQLGYVTKLERRGVTFNLKGIFEIPSLGPLFGELLRLKLAKAKWDRSNSLVDEAVRLEFHEVFGISSDDLKAWLTFGAQPLAARPNLLAKDQEFFQDESEGGPAKEFIFRAGHIEREVEPISRSASPKAKARRLHNDIQNKMYLSLKDELGEKNVGTELDTGIGTTIDLVARRSGKLIFYEIKTSESVRANIRQALPQLLEYAFWPEESRADELVIVSHRPSTADAGRYLRYLRKRFSIPITYRQFDLNNNNLL